eukprot:10312993-Heterocapsa_arctica.AAC.1
MGTMSWILHTRWSLVALTALLTAAMEAASAPAVPCPSWIETVVLWMTAASFALTRSRPFCSMAHANRSCAVVSPPEELRSSEMVAAA